MTFRDDGAIMLSPKSTQEFVPCLYLARLLTHWCRLPVVASLGGITDTHKIGLVKAPPDSKVQAWLAKWLKNYDFLEDKLLNREGEVIVHGPSATSEHYQETQSEVEKAHALALRVFSYAVEAVAELTGYRFEPLELAATGREPLTHLLVLTGSLYPNAQEALRELKEEGWRNLAAVSVRLFNPFPENHLAGMLAQAQVVAVLDRSNSFGSTPPLASRVPASRPPSPKGLGPEAGAKRGFPGRLQRIGQSSPEAPGPATDGRWKASARVHEQRLHGTSRFSDIFRSTADVGRRWFGEVAHDKIVIAMPTYYAQDAADD